MKEPDFQKTVAAEFDKYGKRYSETVEQSLIVPGLNVDYFTKVKSEYLLDLLTDKIETPKKLDVLDIGCGIGNYHSHLVDKVGSLSGVDVSSESISLARQHNLEVSYSVYDGVALPFPDDTFDAAYTICVVHHVPQASWKRFYSEMNRIVKPGGLGIVFEHNPYNPLTLRVVSNCPFDEHAVLLNQTKCRELLSGAGFAEVTSHSILNIPSIGKLTRHLDRAIGILPTGAQYMAFGRVSQKNNDD